MRYIKPCGLQIPPNQHFYFNWAVNEINKFELVPRSNLSILFQKCAVELCHLYSPKQLDNILDQLYSQASDTYKDSDNMMNRFDIMTFFLGAGIKLLSVSKSQKHG